MRLPAKVVAIHQETPTIKSFRLDLHGRELAFMAGQWVDFFVTLDGAEAVGGYSITSSPAEQTAISLAVKRDGSDHPVTNWLHEDAQVGDEVEISLGGDFFYEPDETESVVLIAGGIGLTPLMSIVRSAHELAISHSVNPGLQRVDARRAAVQKRAGLNSGRQFPASDPSSRSHSHPLRRGTDTPAGLTQTCYAPSQ